MKLSIDGIKDKTAWEEAGIKLPAYDVRKVAEDTKASPVWFILVLAISLEFL